MEKQSQDKAGYVLEKPIEGELWVIRRVVDGEVFLCHEFDLEKRPELAALRALYHRGAYTSAAEVLNHENLISLTGPIRNSPWQGSGTGKGEAQQYLLWDWCDAGTLDTIFREPPLVRTAEGFLPESLVWHVTLGMLKALMWLHEGWRERYDNTSPRRRATFRTSDAWMPILHREIEPRNIYFQSPRGTETYGRCKLGNFGSCYVSGSVTPEACLSQEGTVDYDRDEHRYGELMHRAGPIITTEEGDPPLDDVRKWWGEGIVGRGGFRALEASQRPYMTGSELFALGAIVFRMMVGWRLPNPDGCDMCECVHLDPAAPGCKHFCTPDVHLDELIPSLTKYSQGLQTVLRGLLGANRDQSARAVEHYDSALTEYLAWKENSPDGKIFRDDLDDRIFRMACEAKRKGIEQQPDHSAVAVS